MDISKITDGGYYTHVHWAFANITTSWQVDVSGAQDQFDGLLKLTGIKRIVSFGGWGFSTDPYTFNIFRTGMLDGNRQTLAKNIAQFAIDNNLDGIDFDWEYPGVSLIHLIMLPTPLMTRMWLLMIRVSSRPKTFPASSPTASTRARTTLLSSGWSGMPCRATSRSPWPFRRPTGILRAFILSCNSRAAW
jgi:hypothetical protein